MMPGAHPCFALYIAYASNSPSAWPRRAGFQARIEDQESWHLMASIDRSKGYIQLRLRTKMSAVRRIAAEFRRI
jgi:hypothetical protein